MKNLVELYCDVDDFCKVFIPQWQKQLLEDGTNKRQRKGQMSTSEIMTIVVGFHMSHYRDFKNYYLGHVSTFYKCAFPNLLSYTRFLAIMPRVLAPMCAYFSTLKGKPTGIEFVDSTSIKVCHNIRIPRNKTFKDIAQRGKGYLSKALEADLSEQGVTLITTVRKNMKAKAMSLWDRAMLSKRFIIETINDQLKNISYVEHSRHRSMNGFMLNIISGLVAYCLKKNKPSLNITDVERNAMIIA